VTAFQAAVLLLASLLPQAPPRIDEQPKRVCLDAPRAIFQVESRAAEPILAMLSVERWSDEGSTLRPAAIDGIWPPASTPTTSRSEGAPSSGRW
jgi:hypothetical protein